MGHPHPIYKGVKEQHMEGWVNLKLNIAKFLGYTAVYNIYIYTIYFHIYIKYKYIYIFKLWCGVMITLFVNHEADIAHC